jgi:hypothetical protein
MIKSFSIFTVITLAFGFAHAEMTASNCLAVKNGEYTCKYKLVDVIKKETKEGSEPAQVSFEQSANPSSWDSMEISSPNLGDQAIGCVTGTETTGSAENQNLSVSNVTSAADKMTGTASNETSGNNGWPRKMEISYTVVKKTSTSFSAEEVVKTWDKQMKLQQHEIMTADCQAQ